MKTIITFILALTFMASTRAALPLKIPALWVTSDTNANPYTLATNDAVFAGGVTIGGVRLTNWPAAITLSNSATLIWTNITGSIWQGIVVGGGTGSATNSIVAAGTGIAVTWQTNGTVITWTVSTTGSSGITGTNNLLLGCTLSNSPAVSASNLTVYGAITLGSNAPVTTWPAGPVGPQGPQGIQGVQGVQGIQGVTGATGATGTAATVSIGSTTTLAPGSSATVTNTGTTNTAVLAFGIPQGLQGAQGAVGPAGPAGATGTAATVSIGSTTTLAPGSPATVGNSGTTNAAVFDFGIPSGLQGAQGAVGPTGATGAIGPAGRDGTNTTTGFTGATTLGAILTNGVVQTTGAPPAAASAALSSFTGTIDSNHLAVTGVAPGSYGDQNHWTTFTVGADGRLYVSGSQPVSGSPAFTNSLLTVTDDYSTNAGVNMLTMGSGLQIQSVSGSNITIGVDATVATTNCLDSTSNTLWTISNNASQTVDAACMARDTTTSNRVTVLEGLTNTTKSAVQFTDLQTNALPHIIAYLTNNVTIPWNVYTYWNTQPCLTNSVPNAWGWTGTNAICNLAHNYLIVIRRVLVSNTTGAQGCSYATWIETNGVTAKCTTTAAYKSFSTDFMGIITSTPLFIGSGTTVRVKEYEAGTSSVIFTNVANASGLNQTNDNCTTEIWPLP